MERPIALVLLLLLVLAVLDESHAAFVVDSSSAAARRTLTVRTPIGDGSYATTHLFMFDNDKAPAPLETMDAPRKKEDKPSTTTTTSNIVLDKTTGEVREVKWVDPAMSANENPFNMGWWAYALFVIMPAVLLFNDAVKASGSAGFLPQDGPVGFIGRL